MRFRILIVVGILVLAVVLLLPSFAARAAFAIIVLLIGIVWVIKTSRSVKEPTASDPNQTEPPPHQVFARSQLFEATMNGMREGLIVVDRDMRVVASNSAAHRLFNLTRGSLDTQRLTELTRNPAIYSAFLDALQGSERSGVKVETHGPERLVFDLRVVPLMDSNGHGDNAAAGALGVFIDVTRTEKLEQVRQEFLSNVSHELRTPLTAILAFIETLEAGAIHDEEASQRFLSIIRRNAVRMHELIDDTLELSAIESGKVQVRAEQIELSPIVSEVISALANKASEQSVTVTSNVPAEATVYADARRLEQMLTNLVDNAIKFNREGGAVTIRYETRGGEANSPANHPRSAVIVSDTGEGIPAQHLERLFERFYRADRARSREMGGIGLGLAIVKHLARAHGGEVTVTSELGKGSTFTIELPKRQRTEDL
jgi:two-component system, OmpR family, phosphate regulon sensor histidine kinase PhoR